MAKKKNEPSFVHTTTPASQGTGEKPIQPPAGKSMKVDESSTNVPALEEKGLVSIILPTDQLDAADKPEVQLDTAILLVD